MSGSLDSERQRSSTTLPDASRIGAALVLEEFVDMLVVYRRGLANLATRLDTYGGRRLTERTKYHNVEDISYIFQNTSEQLIFEKLQLDSEHLEELLRKSIKSLETDGNLDILINYIAEQRDTRAMEEEMFATALEKQETLERMRQNVADEQRRYKIEEENLKAELEKLRKESEELAVTAAAEMEYVDAWLKSRYEQEELRGSRTCTELEQKLQESRSRVANERLVSQKIRTYLKQTIEQYEKDSLCWSERRQRETKSYDKEIRRLRQEIEKKRTSLDELHKEYTCKQEFIDGCLAEKEAVRKKREHEEHLRIQAIKIQAWWRGLMVRRKLGPFRPEEKRKRPAKPKK